MIKIVARLLGGIFVTIAVPSWAQTTDLSYPGAFEQLRASNPEHYEKLHQIVAGLTEKPNRVEGDWLTKTFGATALSVGRLSLVFGDLSKQSVEFRLDQSQYRLEVVRTDLNVAIEHPQQTLLR